MICRRISLRSLVESGLLLVLAAGALGAMVACTPKAPAALAPTTSREALLEFVNFQEAPHGPHRYETWQLFPQSGVQDPLGLPVHGRFVTLYANDIAFAAAEKWLDPATLNERVEFPAGSILVKANVEVKGPIPGALTIMYKPGIEGYCQSADYWKEGGCYGGGWMFVFYEVPDGPLAKGTGGKNITAGIQPRDFCATCHAAGSDDDYVRSLQRMRRAALPPTRAGAPAGKPPEPGKDPFCAAPALSPNLPPDVALNPAQIADPAQRQRMFDCLSWRSFIALNWPVLQGERGEPNQEAKLWDAKLDGYKANSGVVDPAAFHPRTRVWETYKEVYELFQTGEGRFDWDPGTRQPPLTWNEPPPDPVGEGCDQVQGGKVLFMTHKNRTKAPANAASTADQGVINESVQAFAGQFGVLVDQNQKLVRYDVRMNRSEFEFVLENGFATTAKIGPSGPDSVLDTQLTLPDNRNAKFGRYGGSIELKGSWRELCIDAGCTFKDDPTRYLTQSVFIYEAAGNACSCRPALMGLVGLHIAHKTHWAPQWVWSTFEHIDLVPEDPENPGNERKAIFNPECVAKAATLKCENKPFLAAEPCCPNVPFDKDEFGNRTPNQVTRLDAIGKEAATLNQVFAGLAAGSPFENYVLISTQWPFNGRVPGNEAEIYTRPCNTDALRPNLPGECYTIVPQFLRNTSMESSMASYFRPGQPLHQFSNRGCMNCHGEAGADFSYLWLDAVNQRVRSELE